MAVFYHKYGTWLVLYFTVSMARVVFYRKYGTWLVLYFTVSMARVVFYRKYGTWLAGQLVEVACCQVNVSLMQLLLSLS